MARTLTKPVYGYRVLHARRGGGTAPNSYGRMKDVGTFDAAQITEALAPECHRAKITLNLPALGIHAWRWREHFSFDDRIAFVSGHDKPADRHCPFVGFIADDEWGYQGDSEHVTVTCVSNAFRLKRDKIVRGRWMLSRINEVRLYDNLPCDFNAGGRANMAAPLKQADGTWRMLFTFDGDPDAQWWTLPHIITYLQNLYNAEAAWIANKTWTDGEYLIWPAMMLKVEGLDLWSAMARACDKAGADLYEYITNDGRGLPASSIRMVSRHAGRRVSVKHQALNDDGTFALLDLAKTDLLACQIAESVTSCVTRPIISGAAPLVEITVELGKAWDPAKLPGSAAGYVVPPSAGNEHREYVQRYCTKGSSFADYAEAGRLWDANTDGRYFLSPYNLNVPDVGALADYPAGYFPKMPFAPHAILTQLGAQGRGRAKPPLAYVEMSWDGGSTWHHFPGAKPLRGRLAVYINAEDLAGIIRPAASSTDVPNAATENLFYMLVHSGSSIKMRMTTSIALPFRSTVQLIRQPTAGTAFATEHWYDGGPLGQHRWRAASSRWYGTQNAVDELDLSSRLTDYAESIQKACEAGCIEGQLPIEWPDEDIRLTDRVEKIGGLGYPLKINAGPASRYPRVVGRTLLLTPDTYSMSVQLETERGAGLI